MLVPADIEIQKMVFDQTGLLQALSQAITDLNMDCLVVFLLQLINHSYLARLLSAVSVDILGHGLLKQCGDLLRFVTNLLVLFLVELGDRVCEVEQ